MSSSLTNTTLWAEQEFLDVQLGDKRRTKRLLKTAAAIATTPLGTLPGSLKDLKDLKASYKLFSQKEITYEQVIGPHRQRAREDASEAGEYLLIEDTTELDFTTHYAANGLGRIGDDRGLGLLVHSTLALKVVEWSDNEPRVDIVGLCGQHVWARTGPSRRSWESENQRLSRPRESQRWARVLEELGSPPDGVRWTYVADRESDIYEVFGRCTSGQTDFIVRASHPRALADDDRSLFKAVAEAPVLGSHKLRLRARPGQPARTATIELRSTTVTLRGPWRPGGWQQPYTLNVVQAREINAPKKATAVHWVLLTNWPVTTYEQARRVVATYSRRWLIEEYHKALKSGTNVEKSQLATAQRLTALLGVLAVLAVRLLRLKFLLEVDPDQPVQWDEETTVIRKVLEATVGTPKDGWTNRSLLISIAKRGGFLGRKSDGNPGWITLWRGVKELMLLAEGFSIAEASPK